MKMMDVFVVLTVVIFGVSSTGAHTLTRTYTCELSDDHTPRGSIQILYDGEDFITFNLSDGTWTAAKPRAEQFLKAWEDAGDEAKHWTHYLNYTCIKCLQEHLTYSNSVNQGSHTLQYHTVVSSLNATTTVQLDGETFVSYSSSDAEVIPKTEWIKKIDVDVSDYWKSEKSRMSGDHLDLQHHLSRVEELLHQPKGGSGAGAGPGAGPGAGSDKLIIIVSVLVIVGAFCFALIVICMKKKFSTTTRCQDFESVPDVLESMWPSEEM